MLQFKINSNNRELEKKLNIGLFRLDDYLAFYMNLTAYKEYVDCRGSTINFNFFLLVFDKIRVDFLIPMESLNNTDPIRFIDISVGRTYEDNGYKRTETGIHLIVFPYENNCDGNDFTSDPAIINYYRQFFLHLDEKLIDAKEGFFLH